GLIERTLGYFVEDDTFGGLRIQFEYFGHVPGYGLTLAVFIAGQPDGLGGLGGRLQFGYHFSLGRVDLVFRRKILGDINTAVLARQAADMTNGAFNGKI